MADPKRKRTLQVRREDTWFSLARRAYGDAGRAGDLARANPGIQVLRQGVVLVVEEVEMGGEGAAHPLLDHDE